MSRKTQKWFVEKLESLDSVHKEEKRVYLGGYTYETEILYTFDNTVSGDYVNGGLVTLSNCLVMVRDFPSIVQEYTGSYGYSVACVWLGDLPKTSKFFEEIIECLESMENYLILDENDWSELEYETEQEDWENYGQSDFMRDLEEEEISESLYAKLEEIDDQDQGFCQAVYNQLCEDNNTLPESENISFYFPTFETENLIGLTLYDGTEIGVCDKTEKIAIVKHVYDLSGIFHYTIDETLYDTPDMVALRNQYNLVDYMIKKVSEFTMPQPSKVESFVNRVIVKLFDLSQSL